MPDAQVGKWERPAVHDPDWLVEHDYRDLVAWLDEPDPIPELSGELHDMLLQAFREGIVNGPAGYVDDLISLLAPWGFTLDEVKAPTRVMAGTEDEGIPRQRTQWLVAGIPDAEPVGSPGGHIANHSAAEERLIAWLAGAPLDRPMRERPEESPAASTTLVSMALSMNTSPFRADTGTTDSAGARSSRLRHARV